LDFGLRYEFEFGIMAVGLSFVGRSGVPLLALFAVILLVSQGFLLPVAAGRLLAERRELLSETESEAATVTEVSRIMLISCFLVPELSVKLATEISVLDVYIRGLKVFSFA
jgi:hypothetical protein